jgi:hypothetical protein
MKAVSTSQKSVNFYETARRNITEGCLHTCRRVNLKSQDPFLSNPLPFTINSVSYNLFHSRHISLIILFVHLLYGDFSTNNIV